MIDRWNIDTNITDLAESLLKSPPLNGIHPNYVGMPNPQLKYPIIKGRRLYECEDDANLQLYVMSDDIKERPYSNCHYLCECFVVVGIIRRKDNLIPDFNALKSALTLFFGASGMNYMYPSLTDGNVTIDKARLGNFGIAKVEIQSSRKASDKCGVFNFELLVKFSIYFNKFQKVS